MFRYSCDGRKVADEHLNSDCLSVHLLHPFACPTPYSFTTDSPGFLSKLLAPFKGHRVKGPKSPKSPSKDKEPANAEET